MNISVYILIKQSIKGAVQQYIISIFYIAQVNFCSHAILEDYCEKRYQLFLPCTVPEKQQDEPLVSRYWHKMMGT